MESQERISTSEQKKSSEFIEPFTDHTSGKKLKVSKDQAIEIFPCIHETDLATLLRFISRKLDVISSLNDNESQQLHNIIDRLIMIEKRKHHGPRPKACPKRLTKKTE